MFRCMVDVVGCCIYYEVLLRVDGEYFDWREMVFVKKFFFFVFVYVNIFFDGDIVILKEYELIVEGVIESWVE